MGTGSLSTGLKREMDLYSLSVGDEVLMMDVIKTDGTYELFEGEIIHLDKSGSRLMGIILKNPIMYTYTINGDMIAKHTPHTYKVSLLTRRFIMAFRIVKGSE